MRPAGVDHTHHVVMKVGLEVCALRLRSSSLEVPLNWNTWIRQIHRWLSIIFTLTVIANFVEMALGKPPSWVVYSPLPPLFLLLFTGLYMFVLPYAAKARSS
jgi:cellulose synthase/poly-beta-1,6-N-acetylglucosamine synthase-like glycosyltransferase